jgi:hypothetical protein
MQYFPEGSEWDNGKGGGKGGSAEVS